VHSRKQFSVVLVHHRLHVAALGGLPASARSIGRQLRVCVRIGAWAIAIGVGRIDRDP
jgi:hypothetical protein